jgi:hypothetical protein
MKAQLNAQPAYSTSKVVARVMLLGGLFFGAMYLFLQLCSSLIKAAM